MSKDATLQQAVMDELEWEPSVAAAHIGVAVHNGVVTLTGHVPTFWEKQAAEAAAARVKGVRAVAEELKVELLGNPVESPYGNPIPGLAELGQETEAEKFMTDVVPLTKAAGPESSRALVRRISEEMQKDESLMSAMRRVGALPDKTITIQATAEGVLVGSGGETAEIFPEAADHIFVKML